MRSGARRAGAFACEAKKIWFVPIKHAPGPSIRAERPPGRHTATDMGRVDDIAKRARIKLFSRFDFHIRLTAFTGVIDPFASDTGFQ